MIICLVTVCGCVFDKDYYINFDDISYTPGMFKVKCQKTTDLSDGLPEDAMLPDGTSVNAFLADSLEAATKATSTSANAFIQNFQKWGTQSKLTEISGIYESVDEYGNPITLSGKVIIPTKSEIKRVILVSHYTIGSDMEAPSNSFPLEAQLAQLGYAIVCPDYIGYGITNDRYHPYLMMEQTARNVIDMYLAVMPFLKAIDRAPKYEEIYLMGYSQGGGTTMAVQYMLERDHGPSSATPVKIKRVFAGGGIYDIKGTFESYITTNQASYPCGVPFVIVGQVKGNHLDDALITTLLRPSITRHLDEWFLKKTTMTGQMNKIIDTHVTDEILTPVAFDRASPEITQLYQVMTLNSVLSLAWQPSAPVYMLHSIDDNTVPFSNAASAKVRWADSNIQYNFGHYGSHAMCCLRFVYTVKTILQNENE